MIPSQLVDGRAFDILRVLNQSVLELRDRRAWVAKANLLTSISGVAEQDDDNSITKLILTRLVDFDGTIAGNYRLRRLLSRRDETDTNPRLDNPRHAIIDADIEVLTHWQSAWQAEYEHSRTYRQTYHMGVVGDRVASVNRAIQETERGRIDVKSAESAGTGVFISYRRNGGSEVAQLLKMILEPSHKVFLDVDKPESGHFEKRILRSLDESSTVVVVLSMGCFRPVNEETDWFRQEIDHALSESKKLVPVCLVGFERTEAVKSDSLAESLLRYEAIEWDHCYFAAMVQKLKSLVD